MESETSLTELKARLREIADLRAAASVLDWDQATYMPQGGGAARGRQTALLSRLAHERWISPEVGRLLDELTRYGESLPQDHDDACLIRVARRKYEKALKKILGALAPGQSAWLYVYRPRPAGSFLTRVEVEKRK